MTPTSRIQFRVLVNGKTRTTHLVRPTELTKIILQIRHIWDLHEPGQRLALVTDSGNVTSIHWRQ